IVFNDVGGIVYGKGNDTWAGAGLKHGSYFLLDRIPEDGWYFHDESRLSKVPLCRSNLESNDPQPRSTMVRAPDLELEFNQYQENTNARLTTLENELAAMRL
ncbi:hypothetical protein Tco_1322771, partial [Tanacetum coccineum]